MAVLNLEMIGYYSEKPFSQRYPYFSGPFFPHKGNFIAVLGNSTGKDLVRRIEDTFKAQSRFPIGSLASSWAQTASLSDHWSFWQQGYVAVMITDTAFHRYPYYHTPQDTPDKLDYQRMALVVRGLIPVVRMLADMS